MAKKKKQKCLEPCCEKPSHTRGLCSAHYQAWCRSLRKLSPEEKAACEKEAIEAGLILLPQKTGPKPKHHGRLQKLVSKYREKSTTPTATGRRKQNPKPTQRAAEAKPKWKDKDGGD